MGGMAKMSRNTIVQYYSDQHYYTVFNQRNGLFARIEEKGYEEPRWSGHGPELLDISITNFCTKDCNFCYRNSSPIGKHLSVEDLEMLIEQCEDIGVLQIALGGGNPNQHPDFCQILKIIRERGIIPTYTTNGIGLSDEILGTSSEYCGAVGISAYPPFDFLAHNIESLHKRGIRVNLHCILSSENISQLCNWLEEPPYWFEWLNAIIFLNYKSVGKGVPMRKLTETELQTFFRLVAYSGIKTGFDSCSISGVLKYLDVPAFLTESCEAARFSAFISEDLKMYPCSFMSGSRMHGDLKKDSILKIWNENESFKAFRAKSLTRRCSDCCLSTDCQGGCMFLPEINLC